MRVLLLLLVASLLPAASRGQATAPQVPSGFTGYPRVQPFTVAPRAEPLPNFPCEACHQALPVNTTPRVLAMPHPTLEHGNGRFWCLSCHDAEDRNSLRDMLGNAVAIDDAYLVCGQCHSNRQKDWFYGVHGKRVRNWSGERVLTSCTGCHDPHAPAIAPRAPQPPPPMRAGLERDPGARHETPAVWERHAQMPAVRE